MFEDVMLKGSPKGKRVWTTCAGVSLQIGLVAGLAVAPMVWPEALPPAVCTMLVPTAPMGRPAKAAPEPKPQPRPAAERKRFDPTAGLRAPISIPPKIEMIDEPRPLAMDYPTRTGPYVPGAFDIGPGTGPGRDIAKAGNDVKPAEPPRVPANGNPGPAPVPRVVQGGVVRDPVLVSRVEPRYPQIAIASRIEGVVKLTGVIAVDGHIVELAIESGNPLLAPAALEAVRQWRYRPTRLDGVPVEVVTVIVVTFRLNR